MRSMMQHWIITRLRVKIMSSNQIYSLVMRTRVKEAGVEILKCYSEFEL